MDTCLRLNVLGLDLKEPTLSLPFQLIALASKSLSFGSGGLSISTHDSLDLSAGVFRVCDSSCSRVSRSIRAYAASLCWIETSSAKTQGVLFRVDIVHSGRTLPSGIILDNLLSAIIPNRNGTSLFVEVSVCCLV